MVAILKMTLKLPELLGTFWKLLFFQEMQKKVAQGVIIT